MITSNGIRYDRFLYKHSRSREEKNVTKEEIIERFYVDDEKNLLLTLSAMDVNEEKPEHKVYNNLCHEWVEDGWKHLEYIVGFVSLNQGQDD